MKDFPIIHTLELDEIAPSTKQNLLLQISTDGMGQPILLPIMIAKGANEGPVVGLTAALHGNELNGIPAIHKVFSELKTEELNGTVVGVPVVNNPSLLRQKRRFPDGNDLNHIMPGKENGNISEVYAYRLMERIINRFDILFDLHTASFGRINSLYIRADMHDEKVKRMAMLQGAQILLHNPPNDGTLRGAAAELGIASITTEIGNPNVFQSSIIKQAFKGILNFMRDEKIIEGEITEPKEKPVLCKDSFWIYSDSGGLLTVEASVTQIVHEGQKIAVMHDIFGEPVKEYFAPQRGIVIGKSINPICQTGGRILHLGIIDE